MIGHFTKDLEISSDEENSDEEKFYEINSSILITSFLREQFENMFFEGAILKVSFVRKQFWESNFENVFFLGSNLYWNKKRRYLEGSNKEQINSITFKAEHISSNKYQIMKMLWFKQTKTLLQS